jgi:hypothetical protein
MTDNGPAVVHGGGLSRLLFILSLAVFERETCLTWIRRVAFSPAPLQRNQVPPSALLKLRDERGVPQRTTGMCGPTDGGYIGFCFSR